MDKEVKIKTDTTEWDYKTANVNSLNDVLNIVEEIAVVDFAFIDGTFYDEEEINYRDISEIPHPFIIESIELLKKLSPKEKNKVYFIHLNHTNPALDE